MTCKTIANGVILCFSNIAYTCPYCDKVKYDHKDKLLKVCRTRKSYSTSVRCECGCCFGFTYDKKGNAQTFKIVQTGKINFI